MRLKIPLSSQPPPPPHYESSPRRSHAAGTGLDEPGVPHTEIHQEEQEGTFPFEAGVDGILRIGCTKISEQEENLPSQADVGVRPQTTTTAQVAVRQKFGRPPKNR